MKEWHAWQLTPCSLRVSNDSPTPLGERLDGWFTGHGRVTHKVCSLDRSVEGHIPCWQSVVGGVDWTTYLLQVVWHSAGVTRHGRLQLLQVNRSMVADTWKLLFLSCIVLCRQWAWIVSQICTWSGFCTPESSVVYETVSAVGVVCASATVQNDVCQQRSKLIV